MVTLTPERAALLDAVGALEGKRPELGGLVEDGARARLARLKGATDSTQAARRRLADRVRERSLEQDPGAAIASSASASISDDVAAARPLGLGATRVTGAT